jgi:hypothetical protein
MHTTYAIIENGAVVEYPVDPNTEHALPPFWLGGELAGKQYVFCHNQEPPSTHLEVLVETTPELDEASGNWYRKYVIEPAPAEVVEERRQYAATAAHNSINSFKELTQKHLNQNLTPEQRLDWESFLGSLEQVPAQSGFPFAIDWPVAPNEKPIKIEVTRI